MIGIISIRIINDLLEICHSDSEFLCKYTEVNLSQRKTQTQWVIVPILKETVH